MPSVRHNSHPDRLEPPASSLTTWIRYNDPKPRGLQNYLALIGQRATLQGFVITDYAHRASEAEAQLAKWLAEGKLVRRETRLKGLEHAPEGLQWLFDGKNTGKMLLELRTGEAKL